jgi:hypothetical protein
MDGGKMREKGRKEIKALRNEGHDECKRLIKDIKIISVEFNRFFTLVTGEVCKLQVICR